MDREALLALIKTVVGPVVAEAVKAQMALAGAGAGNPLEQILERMGTMAGARAAAEDPRNKGLQIGRIARALAAGKGQADKAAAYAERTWKDQGGAAVVKALQATTEVAGGYLITEQTSAEVIELLRPKVIVRAMGTPTIPMDSGTLRINKLRTGSTAGYIGEDDDIAISQQGFGRVTLSWKKLAAMVPISNDLLRFSSPSVDGIVRDDIVRSMRQREDLAFIRGNGTVNSPKGLRYWAAAANILPMTATPTLVTMTTDLGAMLLALMNANVGFTSVGWMMAPRTLMALMTVRDSLGNYAFRAELLAGKLWGYPYGVTTQIPVNLGGGGNESEIYLVDFADIVLGESTQLMMSVSEEAAYIENGVLVSAFSRDETLVRVISQHDIGSRHDESIAVLTGVTWKP